jgi:hypothetical protein
VLASEWRLSSDMSSNHFLLKNIVYVGDGICL